MPFMTWWHRLHHWAGLYCSHSLTAIPRGFEAVLTCWMSFLSPNQQHQSAEGIHLAKMWVSVSMNHIEAECCIFLLHFSKNGKNGAVYMRTLQHSRRWIDSFCPVEDMPSGCLFLVSFVARPVHNKWVCSTICHEPAQAAASHWEHCAEGSGRPLQFQVLYAVELK